MIEGIFGKKIGMTHIFTEDGAIVPVTVLKAGGQVTQRKTKDRDGYDAVQLGFGEKRDARVGRPMKGHFKKSGDRCFYHVAEFRGTDLDSYKTGAFIGCGDVFKEGDFVDVRGTTKGKGFQGSMKRHHFRGGAESHGSMHNRAPGSIGSSSDPSRVYKGMRMAGHMGSKGATVENLKVVAVRPEENILLIKGALPGHTNSIVLIKKSIKRQAK
jgi:large subunit ribosomal protein L3